MFIRLIQLLRDNCRLFTINFDKMHTQGQIIRRGEQKVSRHSRNTVTYILYMLKTSLCSIITIVESFWKCTFLFIYIQVLLGDSSGKWEKLSQILCARRVSPFFLSSFFLNPITKRFCADKRRAAFCDSENVVWYQERDTCLKNPVYLFSFYLITIRITEKLI